MENESELEQVGEEIQPYMYEPNPGDDVESEAGSHSSTSSSEDDVDEEFEQANSWRLSSLEWRKYGHCEIMTKTIESFCCCEKAVEYDEYDERQSSAQEQGFTCITFLPSFVQNMLSADVLEVDVAQYLEENYPLDDEELARIHKLYRLASYRRCSRWIFQILGKKNRRVFPSCVYTCIRKKFPSPDGLYTHFKFAK